MSSPLVIMGYERGIAMIWDEERQIEQAREQLVVKDNKLLQTVTRRKYELKAQEQKIIGYLISMIKPEDEKKAAPYIYTFDINTFCDICGIDKTSGGNLQAVKSAINELSDRSFWLNYGEGELLFRWISTADIKKGESTVDVEISSKVFPYLVGLKEKFLQYELWQILPLKSTYSIALYEFLKSWAYKKYVVVTLEQLRAYFGIEEGKYKDFKDFKKKILNVAKKEINELTDLEIEWHGIRHGRFYTHIAFDIKTKDRFEALEAYRRSTAILNGIKHEQGQINMFE